MDKPEIGRYCFPGDKVYRDYYHISAFVAIFLSLPYSASENVGELTVFDKTKRMPLTIRLESGTALSEEQRVKQAHEVDFSELVSVGLPAGMEGRRILLYFMYQFSLNHEFIYYADKSDKEICRDFGYDNGGNRHALPNSNRAFLQTIFMQAKFTEAKNNKYCGLTTIDQNCRFPFLYTENERNMIDEISLNPLSLFSPLIPVDFGHVMGTRKKCFFWNVYVFLADILPRTGSRGHGGVWFQWQTLSAIFRHPYKEIAAFKHNFITTLKDVFEYYPAAESAVDFKSDKTRLSCYHAPSLLVKHYSAPPLLPCPPIQKIKPPSPPDSPAPNTSGLPLPYLEYA